MPVLLEALDQQQSFCLPRLSTDFAKIDYTDIAQMINRPYRLEAHTCHLGRYWIASARCAVSIRSAPARSAMVRASLSVR